MGRDTHFLWHTAKIRISCWEKINHSNCPNSVRFCDIYVRPGDQESFLENHGNSVRLGRSALWGMGRSDRLKHGCGAVGTKCSGPVRPHTIGKTRCGHYAHIVGGHAVSQTNSLLRLSKVRVSHLVYPGG